MLDHLSEPRDYVEYKDISGRVSLGKRLSLHQSTSPPKVQTCYHLGQRPSDMEVLADVERTPLTALLVPIWHATRDELTRGQHIQSKKLSLATYHADIVAI